MKAKRRTAWLLSFLMVFSLIMGTSKMQVFAAGGAGETATFEIRESNGQTGTVQYKLNGSGDFTTANTCIFEVPIISENTIKKLSSHAILLFAFILHSFFLRCILYLCKCYFLYDFKKIPNIMKYTFHKCH